MVQRVQPIRTEDIHALTDFLRNHRSMLDRLRETGRPELLTVHGKAAVVVQDAASYQRVLELADRMETILGVREGIESIERGEGMTLEEVDRSIREKHGLPNRRGATGTDGAR